MNITRRGFMRSILALCAAPAIVRADSLMKIVPRETLFARTGGIGGPMVGWHRPLIISRSLIREPNYIDVTTLVSAAKQFVYGLPSPPLLEMEFVQPSGRIVQVYADGIPIPHVETGERVVVTVDAEYDDGLGQFGVFGVWRNFPDIEFEMECDGCH